MRNYWIALGLSLSCFVLYMAVRADIRDYKEANKAIEDPMVCINTTSNMQRCENKEAVCYKTVNGLQCKFRWGCNDI